MPGKNEFYSHVPAIPNLVGILAPAHSGKDTMADRLVDQYGFVRVNMADVLKRFCEEVFGLSVYEAFGAGKDDRNPKYVRICPGCKVCEGESGGLPHIIDPAGMINREPMQLLGSEFLEQFQPTNGDSTVLVSYTKRVIKHVLDGGWYDQRLFSFAIAKRYLLEKGAPKRVVVADLRKPQQVDMIHELGGVVLRLYREGKGGANVGIPGHVSETSMGGIPDEACDGIIRVAEGLENYRKQIDEIALYYAWDATKC